jgi:8-hydroxy-5-deazaflavin:NADPH oxidoreductase
MDLFVHETIFCRSLQARERYQEIAKGMQGFTMVGTWQTVGMTGRWPTVLNIWQVPGGWSGWAAFLERTYGPARRQMDAYFDQFDEVRSGGEDFLMASVPWSPPVDQLVAGGVRGTLFVHEVSTVRPGAGREYLAAMREQWTPVALDHGHRLVGMYEALLTDTTVVTLWATGVASHVRLMTSEDPRVSLWRTAARGYCTRWHEELLSPAPGTLLSDRAGSPALTAAVHLDDPGALVPAQAERREPGTAPGGRGHRAEDPEVTAPGTLRRSVNDAGNRLFPMLVMKARVSRRPCVETYREVAVADSYPSIGIIGGTGAHGRGLGLRLAAGGHQVAIGSRSIERARHCADALSQRLAAGAPRPRAMTNEEAAATAGIALLTMPWDPDGSLIGGLGPVLAGKIAVSCANPIGFDARGPHHIDTGHGSAAEHVAALLPASRVVGAFHHLSARSLLDLSEDLSAADVLVCGDDEAAKATVRRLCRAVTGRTGIDAGPLRLARQIESFTAVLISVNRRYRTRAAVGFRHVADLDPAQAPGAA